MNRKKLSEKQRGILLLIAGVLVTMALLFPLYWMLTTAVRKPGAAFTNPTFFPTEITLESFHFTADNGVPLSAFFRNSVIVSLGATLLTVLLGVPASYGLARFRNRMSGMLLFVFLLAQMMPSSLILTPLFIAFSKLGLINNLFGVILADATITIPFSVIILRTFFKEIPRELEEASIIDGCGALKTFVHIMVPVCYPGIVTAMAMALFMAWGDMVFSLTFLNKDPLKTLPLILYKAMGELGVRWEVLMAYATMVVAPIVVLFVLLQRHIVSGLTAGAVKG